MSKKSTRQVVFVCSSISSDGYLLSKIIAASSSDKAASLFLEQENVIAKEILGPFYKKRVRVESNTQKIRFSNESKRALFDNWLVNAMLLKEPDNHAYLIFIKRIDDKKMPAPKGSIVVPISDLRFQ